MPQLFIPGVHPNILGTTTNEEMLCTASNDKARLPMDKRTACAVQITGQCERAERPMKPIMTSDGCRALQMVIQAKHAECCHLRECIDVIKSQAGADIRQLRQQIAATEERYKSEVAHVGACLAQKDQLAIDLKVTLKQLTEENKATKCRLEVLKSSGSCDAELNYSRDTCFNESKSLKCCAPVLKLPEFQKELVLRTDASDTGLGTLLLQTHDDQLYSSGICK